MNWMGTPLLPTPQKEAQEGTTKSWAFNDRKTTSLEAAEKPPWPGAELAGASPAHQRVAGSIPSWGVCRRQDWCFSLSLSNQRKAYPPVRIFFKCKKKKQEKNLELFSLEMLCLKGKNLHEIRPDRTKTDGHCCCDPGGAFHTPASPSPQSRNVSTLSFYEAAPARKVRQSLHHRELLESIISWSLGIKLCFPIVSHFPAVWWEHYIRSQIQPPFC